MPDFNTRGAPAPVFGEEINFFAEPDLYQEAQALFRKLAVATGTLFEWDAAEHIFEGNFAVGLGRTGGGEAIVAFRGEFPIMPKVETA